MGSFRLSDSVNRYVVGANIYASLNIDVEHHYPIQITVPRKGKGTAILPEDAFTFRDVNPRKCAIPSSRSLTISMYLCRSICYRATGRCKGQVSAYEFKLRADMNPDQAKAEMKRVAGKEMSVKRPAMMQQYHR
jgi:hypothetical protein